MPRHLHLKHDIMAKFAETGILDLSEADKEILGVFELTDEHSDYCYGHQMLIDGRWENRIDNPTPAEGVCSSCLGSGWWCNSMGEVGSDTLTIELSVECPACRAAELKNDLLPRMYREVDYRYTKPYEPLPVPVNLQQKLIDAIRKGDLDGHSVLYSGTSRTGKTYQTCCLLHRMVEVYLSAGFEIEYREYRLPIYRINADRWLSQHLAHDTHKRDSDAPQPPLPEPNIHTILRLQRHDGPSHMIDCPDEFPPILLIEELDKFKPSEYKLDSLYTVMNAVFEAGGMIISTSNLTPAEIKARFPDWFYRRLVESSQDKKIRHRDLHKAVKRKVKSAPDEPELVAEFAALIDS